MITVLSYLIMGILLSILNPKYMKADTWEKTIIVVFLWPIVLGLVLARLLVETVTGKR